jgi:hypothetical protein|tara:strand:+ start:1870 stop:2634 length:765 start_codon:yes stop_codon:yes gene_type:complete
MPQENISIEAVNDGLIYIQTDIRNFFNWKLSDDLRSAENLLHRIENSGIENWTRNSRNMTLTDISNKLNNGVENVAIIGAAVEKYEILDKLKSSTLFIAADGAVGIFETLPDSVADIAWSRLICVVSDADGGIGVELALQRKIPIILHAHGDNLLEWNQLLSLAIQSYTDTKIVLTHQTPKKIDGMFNVGGFTDGDRAVCFTRSLGVPRERISILGTRTDIVGKWSGITNEKIKLLKLQWMEKILQILDINYSD